jgi:hypothetical protein
VRLCHLSDPEWWIVIPYGFFSANCSGLWQLRMEFWYRILRSGTNLIALSLSTQCMVFCEWSVSVQLMMMMMISRHCTLHYSTLHCTALHYTADSNASGEHEGGGRTKPTDQGTFLCVAQERDVVQLLWGAWDLGQTETWRLGCQVRSCLRDEPYGDNARISSPRTRT